MASTAIDERPTLGERYGVAVSHGSTKAEVIGAMGIAGKVLVTASDGSTSPGSPLGAALYRLFSGDSRAASEIVDHMAEMAWKRSDAMNMRPVLKRVESKDLARAVLDWYRNNKCRSCNGLGKHVIPGTTTLKNLCNRCHDGIVPFERVVRAERVELARWLSGEIEREQGRAGALAMQALSPRLVL